MKKQYYIIISKQDHGFTLTEIVIVMLITSIIVLSVNASFQQVHTIWSRVETPRPQYQVTRQVFDVLRQELNSLYLPPQNEDESSPAPFSLEYTGDGKQTLSFCSLTPSWTTSSRVGRPARITYTFIQDTESETGSLERSELAWAANRSIGSENQCTIASGLSNCEFLAIESDSSDTSGQPTLTAKERPPKAIRVSITWPATQSTPSTHFETCFLIASQERVDQE